MKKLILLFIWFCFFSLFSLFSCSSATLAFSNSTDSTDSVETYKVYKTANELVSIIEHNFLVTLGEIKTNPDSVEMAISVYQNKKFQRMQVIYKDNTPAIVDIADYRLVFSDVVLYGEDDDQYQVVLSIYPL